MEIENFTNVVAAVLCHPNDFQNDGEDFLSLKQETKVLIAKRAESKRHGNLWEFPGGKCEKHELFEQTLARELKEELNLDYVAPLSSVIQKLIIPLFAIEDPGSLFRINFIRCYAVGEPILTEHTAIQWVKISDLEKFDLCPSDKKFAEWLTSTID